MTGAEMNKSGSKENHEVVLIGMPCWDVGKPFHSLAIVAAVARDAGFTVKLYDLNIGFYHLVSEKEQKYWAEENTHLWVTDELPRELWENHEDWLHNRLDTILEENNPALLCFTVNFCTRHFSIRGAKYLKSKRPDIPIMFGGVDCFPGEQNEVFLSSEDGWHCDIICQGECEIAFKEYLENFAETGDWRTTVPGFAYYAAAALVNTGDVELPTLKNKQPLPAFDLFDLSQYTEKGSLPFYFSRGCVNKCHFCSERPNFRKYRCRSAEEAVEEIKAIIPYTQPYAETPTLNFADSILNASMKELEKFADLIIENGIKITWGGQGHINRRLTYEMLEKLKRAGFSSVFWGIESGSQRVVDLMNKRYSWTDARRILDDCCKLGIRQHIPILVGFPGETAEDMVDNLEVIFRYQDKQYCTIHQPNMIVVRPKSPLYERYTDFGLANNNYYDWSTTDLTNTLHIRIARRFLIRQAHGNHELSMEKLVDTEEIRNINLDDPGVARDQFHIIREALTRAGEPEALSSAIEQWESKKSPAGSWYKRLTGIVRRNREDKSASPAKRAGNGAQREAEYLERWNQLDKNSAEGREKLYGLILLALEKLKTKVK